MDEFFRPQDQVKDAFGNSLPARRPLPPLTPEAIEALNHEVTVLGDGDPIKATKRVFERNLPAVAETIVNAALYSLDEKTRLNASKYIYDKMLAESEAGKSGGKSKMEELLESLMEPRVKPDSGTENAA